MRRLASSSLLALALALSSWLTPTFVAAEPPRPPKTPLVLKAARMFDATTGANVSPGLVVVDKGVITGVGARAVIPANATTVDLGDATLLPGLIDVHTHLTGEASNDWKADELDGFKMAPAERGIRATVYAERTLLAGFTTVRDVGSSDLVDVGLRNAIDAGVILGPRMLVAVNAIGSRGGHCDPTAGYTPDTLQEPGIEAGVADGPDQMRAAVRYAVKHGADVIKTCASGGVLSLRDKVDSPQLTQAEVNALVDEAHDLGLKVAAHAHGSEAAKRAVRAGVDSIEHGSFLDDEALDLMKRRGSALVYTPVLCLRDRLKASGAPPQVVDKANAAIAKMAGTMRRALAKGVLIAFGSDAGVCPHGSQVKQFADMVQRGMTPAAVLRSATSGAAKLLGLEGKVGALRVGLRADVIAVPGDPLRDVTRLEHVSFVLRDGVVVRHSGS
ncbi:MAG: amidohydrolase family protein [Kofleriaceae bacterium]